MDRIDAMTAFVAVADLAGFAPAARRLKLSPSAVTRMIAALEDHLGTRLLQRTTRSVTLTDAGSRYLERVRRVLVDVHDAEHNARVERSVPTGRFVITAPNAFGRLHVAPLMSKYLAKYPAVTGELTLADRFVNLVEEGVDVAVRIGVLEDSSLVVRHVGATRRVLVASPKYLARRKTPRTAEALQKHDLIQLTALATQPEWRFIRDGHESRITFSPRYVTNSADAALAHAELGAGISMQLAYQVADSVRAGRLRIVLRELEPPPLPIHLVYPSTRLLSAKVRAFVDMVSAKQAWQFIEL